MPESDAKMYHLNPFDLTKIWPHADYPLIDVGVLELNGTPTTTFKMWNNLPNPHNSVGCISKDLYWLTCSFSCHHRAAGGQLSYLTA